MRRNISKYTYIYFNDKSLIIIALIIYLFVIGMIYFSISNIQILTTSWIKDDAFYYLKIAQNFCRFNFFTFDGINKTYGFQPLYELILIPIAFIIKSKIVFVKFILVSSFVVYLISSYLIYLLAREFLSNKWSLIPSLLWLSNIDLINVFTSGMENILSVFLLLLLLLEFRKKNFNNSSIIRLGILSAFLILTRINMLIIILIFVFYLLFWSYKVNFKNKILKVLLFLSIVSIFLLPWILYCFHNFNTIFPNSGTRKLIGSFAAVFQSSLLPDKIIDFFLQFLPKYESILFHNHVNLPHPTLYIYIKYVFGFLPSLVIGSGSINILKVFYQQHKWSFFILTFILLLLVFLIVNIFLKNYKVYKLKDYLTYISKAYTPLILLFIISFFNVLINWLLLPTQLTYGTWYAFPEILFVLFIIVFGMEKIFNLIKARFSNSYIIKKAFFLIIIFFSFSFINLTIRMFPNNPYHYDSFLVESWKAKDWINSNIKNIRIGAWSSGILGYFTNENITIINLDGLANSPDYASKIYSNSILYNFELTNKNLTWDYIKKMGIRYIADASFISNTGSKYFLGAIPPNNYKIIYESGNINWNELSGPRTYRIIKLKY